MVLRFKSILPSTDVIQIALTLKITTAKVIETSVSHCQQQTVLFRTTFTRTIKLNLLLCDTLVLNVKGTGPSFPKIYWIFFTVK